MISQLPFDIKTHLHRIGEFYVCSRFTEDAIGPSVIRIDGWTYYRFMDFIYLPYPPEKLSSEQVIEVCDLRLEYLGGLVDFKFNNCIVSAMVEHARLNMANITAQVKALDFGCGSGLSSQLILRHMPNLELVGVDISEKAVLHCQKQGLTAFLTYPGTPLPFEVETFDLIFTVFVMHFHIDVLTLTELRRVLRTSGQFIFNVYRRNIEEITQQLKDAGFRAIEVQNDLLGISKKHMIVSCI
jgi:SAM-dependent methyltransferase